MQKISLLAFALIVTAAAGQEDVLALAAAALFAAYPIVGHEGLM